MNTDDAGSFSRPDSLASFVSGVPKRRIPPYNPYPTPQFSVRDLVVGINDSTLTSQDASGFYEILKDREKVPVKLLKFREDVRPGYVGESLFSAPSLFLKGSSLCGCARITGTWSKISKVVTPRTPFCRDGAVLNYEHDSEGEWEEEPDDAEAENVGSDAEMSADENEGDASEVDSWLAEDDEILYESGYEEDGDIVMMDADASRRPHRDLGDDDDDDDIIVVEGEQEKKERLKREKEKKRRIEEKQKKKKANGPLLALVKGPVWEDQDGVSKEPAFKGMKIRFLNGQFPFLPLLLLLMTQSSSRAVASVQTRLTVLIPSLLSRFLLNKLPHPFQSPSLQLLNLGRARRTSPLELPLLPQQLRPMDPTKTRTRNPSRRKHRNSPKLFSKISSRRLMVPTVVKSSSSMSSFVR
jgi:hypothetical protein